MGSFNFFNYKGKFSDENSDKKEQEDVVDEAFGESAGEPDDEQVEMPDERPDEEQLGKISEDFDLEKVAEPEEKLVSENSEEILALKENLKILESLRQEMRLYKEEMKGEILALRDALKEKDELLDKQEEIIKRQSHSISKFQDDLLYKIQKPLIMEMIEIADNIRLILNDKELVESKDFVSLIERVKGLSDWVNASLSNNSVKSYSLTGEFPASIDRKKQEVIDVEDTDDPAKDSTYYTERPGYIWSMPYLIINSDIQLKKALEDAPKSFEFIIRPEEIVKYKYSEVSEENKK